MYLANAKLLKIRENGVLSSREKWSPRIDSPFWKLLQESWKTIITRSKTLCFFQTSLESFSKNWLKLKEKIGSISKFGERDISTDPKIIYRCYYRYNFSREILSLGFRGENVIKTAGYDGIKNDGSRMGKKHVRVQSFDSIVAYSAACIFPDIYVRLCRHNIYHAPVTVQLLIQNFHSLVRSFTRCVIVHCYTRYTIRTLSYL